MSIKEISLSPSFEQDIEDILNYPEVVNAKKKLENSFANTEYLSIKLTPKLRYIISTIFDLHLDNLESIPMRWVKGDTNPHIDLGMSKFNNTYLMYLTDCQGDFCIDNNIFPIKKGTGFIFPETMVHYTNNTGTVPRLLLGPISEDGFSVGLFSIDGTGGTTVYMRQNGANIEYSFDQSSWSQVYMPCGLTNTNTESGFFKVEFITDITLNSAFSYFYILTEYLQIGSETLKSDGTRPRFFVDNVADYPGLIYNGNLSNNGSSNINIFNLNVVAINGSTLATEGGWVGQSYFSRAASNNYIINCSSNGDISLKGGGIVGSAAGSTVGSNLKIIGCNSSGAIGVEAGGIVGNLAGNLGNVSCYSCWSSGAISNNGGGIAGEYAAYTGTLTISNCYSTGLIGTGAGGICGANAAYTNGSLTITNCYTTGSIGSGSGGILGQSIYNTVTISNCYTTGNVINSNGGGITGNNVYNVPTITNSYTSGTVVPGGGFIRGGSGVVPATCYSEAYNSSSGWNTTNATTVLTGLSGPIFENIIWLETTINQPFELKNMGYTPYNRTMIITSSPPSLQKVFDTTVLQGNSTSPAIVSGKSYVIMGISSGIPASYSTISINSSSGVISTSVGTQSGVYQIHIRNNGSYNISTVNLTVASTATVPCLTEDTIVLTPFGYTNITNLKKNDYVITSDNRIVKIAGVYNRLVVGNSASYPYIISKDSISIGYPKMETRISGNHLIMFQGKWIHPRLSGLFLQDTSNDVIKYYHIELQNYKTDHLVVNGGLVVESYAGLKKNLNNNFIYIQRIKSSYFTNNTNNKKNKPKRKRNYIMRIYK